MSPPADVLGKRWRRLLTTHWILLVASSLGLSLLVTILAEPMVQRFAAIDSGVRSWILAHRGSAGMQVFGALTLLGSKTASLLIVITTAIWLSVKKHRLLAAVFASAPAAAVLLLLALRELVGRQRPAGAVGIVDNPSFPAGHMIAATSIWVTLMYLLWRERLIPQFPATLIAIGWPIVVGISRVYLDVHWTSDVLAGWVLGLGLALAAAAVYERWRRKGSPPAR